MTTKIGLFQHTNILSFCKKEGLGSNPSIEVGRSM